MKNESSPAKFKLENSTSCIGKYGQPHFSPGRIRHVVVYKWVLFFQGAKILERGYRLKMTSTWFVYHGPGCVTVIYPQYRKWHEKVDFIHRRLSSAATIYIMVNKSRWWTKAERTQDNIWPKAPEGVSIKICSWFLSPMGSITSLSAQTFQLLQPPLRCLIYCLWFIVLPLLRELEQRKIVRKVRRWGSRERAMEDGELV